MSKKIFTDIYHNNEWSSKESISGMGSTLKFTSGARQFLPAIFDEYNFRHLLDLACGDFNWMKTITQHLETYMGLDIVEPLIKSNLDKYWQMNWIDFDCKDIVNDKIDGTYDVVIAKDVLVHLSNKDIVKVFDHIRAADIEYVIVTNFDGLEKNTDIETGDWRPINFELAPFNFGKPAEVITEDETYMWNSKLMQDKTLSMYKIEDIGC